MRQTNCFLFIGLLIGMVCIGCATDDKHPGELAQIPDSARTITFDGGSEGPVEFSHETHSTDYYEGVCIFCHDHESINSATHWSCRDCHTAGQDREDLCEEPDLEHGCVMTQCQSCHVLEGPPAPDGMTCGVVGGGCHN